LLRRPSKRKHDRIISCATAMFWCIVTVPAGRPSTSATTSPTFSCSDHQPSPQLRTPRVSHWSRNCCTLARAAAGIAPSELLIR